MYNYNNEFKLFSYIRKRSKSMTAEEIRDLKYLSWRDNWAWMENMKGKRWLNLIKQEKSNFNKLAKQQPVSDLTRQFEEELKECNKYTKMEGFALACGNILIALDKGSKFIWRWKWDKKGRSAYDIDYHGNIVWYITTDDNKHYKNRLICESIDKKIIWSKSAISYQIAIKGDLCYYIKLENYFNTVELCVCNAKTGNQVDVLYKEKDKRRDIILVKETNKSLYLKSIGSSDTKLWRIENKELIPMDVNSVLQMPVGKSIYGEQCRLTKKTQYDKKWEKHGKPLKDWILPEENPEYISLQSGLVLTMHNGSQAIWSCSSKSKPQKLFAITVGEIYPNYWSSWEGNLTQSFFVKTPHEIPYMIHILNNKLIKQTIVQQDSAITKSVSFKPLEVKKYYATSHDKTKVPFVIIHQANTKKIRGLFVYVYGAYGSSTPVGWPYQSWYPILNRGWAISYAFVRGGGDNDFAWAELARRENRHRSIEDFEAVIRSSQELCKVSPDKTVIYGRSAGGVPIGAIVSRYPDGQLAAAAFTEVPYVDVLRTSSNPELPLTIGEYEEFGNPIERIVNFQELINVSPINTIPPEGANGVFVIARTGLLDRQVFAYEPFKWIQKLRGYGSFENSDITTPKGKYITYEENEAHSYSLDKSIRCRAVDLAILESWLQKKLQF